MGLLLQMDLSVVYGGAQVHPASFPDTEGPGLGCASEHPIQGGRDLHSSSCYRETATVEAPGQQTMMILVQITTQRRGCMTHQTFKR